MSEAIVSKLFGPDGKPIGAVRWGFDEEADVKARLFESLGDLDDIEIFHNDVLVCKYIREKVSQSLVASKETHNADKWEGVIGLVLKLGPAAFVDDEHNKFHGCKVEKGDWALFRNSDGWDKNIQLIGAPVYAECRIIQDAHIRGRVKYPARIF